MIDETDMIEEIEGVEVEAVNAIVEVEETIETRIVVIDEIEAMSATVIVAWT
jgi:hypothetical protein